jgi:hypothetical protein
MPPPPRDLEARVSALETRMDDVAADAAAARHLAAARDRDLADLTIKVDANRAAISALGEQTNARFSQVDGRIDRLEREMRNGFAELRREFSTLQQQTTEGFTQVRARLDQTAGGLAQVVEMLGTLIDREGGQ